MISWIAVSWRVVRAERERLLVFLLAGFSLISCAGGGRNGDKDRGRELFTSLPCSGCHGAMAQGGFGPNLAGTELKFQEMRLQVRSPRDQMPAFDRSEVSDRELQDIYSWLTSLPAPTPTPRATLPPVEATAAARNRFFPEFDAGEILAQMENLDESALRIRGNVVAVRENGRFTEIDVEMIGDRTLITVLVLYDTNLARQSFPAAVGDEVTLYGVGTAPFEKAGSGGRIEKIPRIHALHVVVH